MFSQSDIRRNELSPGTLVAEKYKILSVIGRGGMGTVYNVHQIFLGVEYALKLLATNQISEVAVRRFKQEARTASLLRHPNLIEVRDFGLFDQNQPYLVMDRVKGYTLAQHLKRVGSVSVEYAVALAVQIGRGLQYAHEHGVVHRDIKPSNIILLNAGTIPEEGMIKIFDFGIAKLMQSDDGEMHDLTQTGEIFGSPVYMSPEQCQGAAVDHRCDIYSTGCLLFECLTGTPPFLAENAMATMVLRLTQAPPSLKEASLGKDFPLELESTIAKMLAVDPEERYQSFLEVVDAFKSLQAADVPQSKSTTHSLNILNTLSAPNTVAPGSSSTGLHKTIDGKDRKFFRTKNFALISVTALLSILSVLWLDRQVFFREEFTADARTIEKRKNDAMMADDRSADKHFLLYQTVKTPTYTYVGTEPNRIMRMHFPTKIGKISIGRDAVHKVPAEGDIDIPAGQEISIYLNDSAGARPNILENLLDVPFDTICFDGRYRISNESLDTIGKMRHVRKLDVDGGELSSLDPIEDIHLKNLDVGETRVGASDILGLKHLGELEVLTFGPIDSPHLVLTELAKLNSLRSLLLKGSMPSDNEVKVWRDFDKSDLDIVANMSNLESLSFQWCPKIDDEGIKRLLKLKKLKTLCLKDCPVTAKIIPILRQMRSLESLVITTEGWAPQDVLALRKLPLRMLNEAKTTDQKMTVNLAAHKDVAEAATQIIDQAFEP